MPPPALVIGNSYVGAVLKAAQADPAGALFDFAAAGGENYAGIAVDKGRLANARTQAWRVPRGAAEPLLDGASPLLAIRDYRALFLYGYLPGPVELALARRRLRKQQYSARVVARALDELIAGSASLTLRERLRAATDAPVFVLPGNSPSTAGPIASEERAEMVALLRAHAGEDYLPAPDILFLADGAPDPAFYKDSVGLRPLDPARDVQAKHDLWHYNAAGGAVWLARMAEVVRGLD